ncbi:MAG: FmdB family zinc ribbon protein [bacterium]
MPIREFRCGKCRHEFEELIFSESDRSGLKCPKCGSRRLTALLSVFGVSGAEKKVSGSSKSCGSCSSHSCSTCG